VLSTEQQLRNLELKFDRLQNNHQLLTERLTRLTDEMNVFVTDVRAHLCVLMGATIGENNVS
jgi:hypothetical protein